MEKTKYIVLHESTISSIIKDIFTFGGLAFLFWFNYKYIGGSYIVNALILVGLVSGATKYVKNGNNSNKFNSIDELLEWAKNKHNHK